MNSWSKNVFHYSIANRVRIPHFRKFLCPSPGEKILDLGCGVGYFCALIRKHGATAVGMDLDPRAVRKGAEDLGGLFLVGRAESLPFVDSSFDKILCSEVLEHIEDDGKVVEEIRRVGKPGATVVITVPSPDGVFGSKIKSICHDSAEPGSVERHVRPGYRRPHLESLLRAGGIRIEKVIYTMVFLAEIIMGLTKVGFSLVSGRKNLEGQAQVGEVGGATVFRLYKAFFPIGVLLARLGDALLAPFLKGHVLVVKGVIEKDG